MKNKKLFTTLIASLVCISTLVACGEYDSSPAYEVNMVSANKGATYEATVDYADYDAYDTYYDEAPMMEETADYGYDNGAGDSTTALSETQANASVAANRKLIKTVSMDVETLEFDNYISLLNQEVANVGGYIEYEYSSNGSQYDNYKVLKHSSITVRVPDSKLDDFVGKVSGAGSVVNKTTSTEDVTLSYVDTESKKEMYLAEQESLLALLEKAETIEDITYLTERLTQIRYNIESMESTLRVYDDLVDYATVRLSIQEVEVLTPVVVVEPEPKTTKEIIAEGFKASCQNVFNDIRDGFVNFVIRLPYIVRTLVILAVIGGIIFAAIKIFIAIIKKKSNKKKKAVNNPKETGVDTQEGLKKLQEINKKEEANKNGESN